MKELTSPDKEIKTRTFLFLFLRILLPIEHWVSKFCLVATCHFISMKNKQRILLGFCLHQLTDYKILYITQGRSRIFKGLAEHLQ